MSVFPLNGRTLRGLSKPKFLTIILRLTKNLVPNGVSPSGKAAAFGAAIRRFESYYPSQQKNCPRGSFFFTKLCYSDRITKQTGGSFMRVIIEEHEVSATHLTVYLKGIPRDTIKLSEFENNFKPTLQGLNGVISSRLSSGYGNAFEQIEVQFERGLNTASLAYQISKALEKILDLNIVLDFRESNPIDYL